MSDETRPQFYPVFLNLTARHVVVIGGGSLAEEKVTGLLAAGCRVTVVSDTLTTGLEQLAADGRVEVRARAYTPGDLADAHIAFAADEDRSINAAVWREAEERGVLLNAVDDTPHCHFIAPAIHRQGDVVIAISTGGASPALAVHLRKLMQRLIGPEYGRLATLLGSLRPRVARLFPEMRKRTELYHEMVASDLLDLLRSGDVIGARARALELIESARNIRRGSGGTSGGNILETAAPAAHRRTIGSVAIVGAGPGAKDLITVRGLDRLRCAQTVVYDRLVHPDLVAEAPADARRIYVGKEPGASVRQEFINALLVTEAREGRFVVRLKGGDPFVFGRGAEEAEALRAAGIAYEVVPGLTSATAVPASAGIPVTHRSHAAAFAVVTGHLADAAHAPDWDALAKIPTLVVLMGRATIEEIARRLMQRGRSADTPAAAVASGTWEEQRTVFGTLATIGARIAEAELSSPITLVVGDVVNIGAALHAVEQSDAPLRAANQG
jgi:uroporphyrin-III C-methyltransferase/precorrin-2 dehydrogenase/sirohydrochlorin ferrochelatase